MGLVGGKLNLAGEPGSPERLEQVRRIDPDTYGRLEDDQRLETIGMLLDRWNASGRDDLDGHVVRELARLSWDTGDVNVVRHVRDAVEQIAGDAEPFDRLMEHRLEVETQRGREQHAASEEARMENVRSGLEAEYSTIERKLGPAGLEAADDVARQIGAGLYDENVDPEQMRVALRAAGEVGRSVEHANNVFGTLAELDEEFKRYGPGWGANDETREKWEAELAEGTVEVYEREIAKAHPDAAASRALQSRAVERMKTKPFEQALDAELDALSQHDSTAEHRQALRDARVREFERTRDPDTGEEKTDRHREHWS